MKVSDYKSLIAKVESGANVELLHVHSTEDGTLFIDNRIVIENPSATAVYRFLNGFSITGEMSDGVFYGQVTETLQCDDTCGEITVVWEHNWKQKNTILAIKEGKMYITNKYDDDEEKEICITINSMENYKDNWDVAYFVGDNCIKQGYIRSSSLRYVITKVFSSAEKIFEIYYWGDMEKIVS